MKLRILVLLGVLHYTLVTTARIREESFVAEETFLDGQDAHFDSVVKKNELLVNDIKKAHKLVIDCGTLNINNITATNIDTTDLTANDAFINNLNANNTNTANLTANNIDTTNLTATNASIDNLDVDTLNVSGTSLVGCDVFVGCNLYIPHTTSATQGVVFKYSGTTAAPTIDRFLHNAGDASTYVGRDAGQLTNTGVWNTGLGVAALMSITTGSSNTALGVSSLRNCTIGSNNIAVGINAGINITNTGNNIYIGNPGVSTDSGVIYIGTNGTHTTNKQAGIRNITPVATDTAVVSIDSNHQLGTGRIYNNIDIVDSTSTQGNILKNGQVFINNAGTNSTYVGRDAGQLTNTGVFNTGLGVAALTSITTGQTNVALGVSSLRFCTIGSANTGVGTNSLLNIIDGGNNIAVGNGAGSNITGASNNIYIGNAGVSTDSGAIYIGTNGIHTTNKQAGIFGVNNLGVPVYINAAGQLGTTSSARAYKHNITGIPAQTITNFSQLNPVQFTYINDGTNALQYGYIADDVNSTMPELVFRDAEGNIFTLRYQLLYALLHQWLKNVAGTQQQQKSLIAQLQTDLTTAQGLINTLLTRVIALENTNNNLPS